MLRKFVLGFVIIFGFACAAQVITPGVTYVTSNPSGSCFQGSLIQVNTITGAVSTCQTVVAGVGTWGLVTGSGGGLTSINTDMTAAQVIAGTTGNIVVTDNGTGTHTLNVGTAVALTANLSAQCSALGVVVTTTLGSGSPNVITCFNGTAAGQVFTCTHSTAGQCDTWTWTATPTLGVQATTAGSLTLAQGGSITLAGTGASPGSTTINTDTAGTTLKLGAVATVSPTGGVGSPEFNTAAEFDNGTCTTAATISAANGNRQKVLLTNADTCALTFTQPSSGTITITLKITQSAAGSFNGTISGGKWPGGTVPTITATTGAIDFIVCYLDGTNAYCVPSQNFQ